MITIENEQYVAVINPLGAELTSLKRKADGFEYIWNDTDKKYWQRHAPILFPAIGKSNADAYTLDGKKYAMKQHGFARDYPFDDIALADSTEVTLTQHATDATKAVFPFDYALAITYKLQKDGLTISIKVTNNSRLPNNQMPYALGIHPGFALDQPLEQYKLTVTNGDTPLTKFGIGPVPFRNGELTPIPEAQGDQLPLSHQLLDNGLLILDVPHATSATLASQDGKYHVTFDLQDYPYLTLWSPEKKNAPFVCVEPFAGLPDQAGEPTNWYRKTGNNVLESGDSQQFDLKLTLA